MSEWYSLARILQHECRYRVILGERSNGKTTAVLERAVDRYYSNGSQCAMIRRWDTDFMGSRGASLFDNIVHRGRIIDLTNGEWDRVYYRARRWYLARPDPDREGGLIIDEMPFLIGYTLNGAEHDKGTSARNVRMIIFDEFTTLRGYLPDEFTLFLNTISTIVRKRGDVEVFLIGNTVDRHCPHFASMGLKKVARQKQGTIVDYPMTVEGEMIAVEYCATSPDSNRDSDPYFAFPDPSVRMITSGEWEVKDYPRLDRTPERDAIAARAFLRLNDDCAAINVIRDDDVYLFVHRWTRPIPDESLVFDVVPNTSRYYSTSLDRGCGKIGAVIRDLFRGGKTFYSTNEVGDLVRAFDQLSG